MPVEETLFSLFTYYHSKLSAKQLINEDKPARK